MIAFGIYFANTSIQNQKFNNDCKKLIEKYDFIDNYKVSGYLNCILKINVNDKFNSLDESEKTSKISGLFTSYEFLNRSYYIKKFKDIKDIDTLKLVTERKIIVNNSGNELVYNYKNIEKSENTTNPVIIENSSITTTNLSDEEKGFAWAVAKKEVKDVLKAPSSAKFPFSYSSATITKMDNLYTVISYVEADNSFGTNLKVKFSVSFERSGNNYTVKSILVDE